MSASDWYRAKVGSVRPSPSVEVPRFIVGQDGRAQPTFAQEGTEAVAPPQPWLQPVRPGDPPIGQTRLTDGLTLWRGSRDAQASDGHCPNCRSGNYLAELVAELAEGQGGESGKRSLGHCMDCGFRPGGRGPSLQMRGVIRGSDQGEIPVEQARSAVTPESLRFNGRAGIIARIR